MNQLIYMFKQVYHKNSVSLLCFILEVCVNILYNTAQIYLLPSIIMLVESNQTIIKSICYLFCLLAAYCLLSFLKIRLHELNDSFHIQNRHFFIIDCSRYALNTSFDMIDDEKKLKELYQAERAVQNGRSGFEGASRKLIELTTSLVSLLIYCLLSRMLSFKIFLGLAISIILNFLIKKKKSSYEQEKSDEKIRMTRKMNYTYNISKDLNYAKDIRIFKLGDLIHQYCLSWIKELGQKLSTIYKKIFLNDIFTEAIYFICNLYIFLYLSDLIIAKQIGISDFTMSMGLITGIELQFTHLLNDYASIKVYIRQIKQFNEMINQDKPSQACKSIEELKPPYKIEFEDIHFSYGNHVVFEHFNLVINANEKLAIIGTNGSGKSTLIKLLCRFYEPSQGVIKINDVDIKSFDLIEYYQLIGAVFQDIEPLAFSIKENIVGENALNHEKLSSSIEKAGLSDDIAQMKKGIETVLTKILTDDGIALSGGQMQKLMMARAIYKNAGILILDEPTAALDVKAEEKLYREYYALCQDKTSIFISHRLASTKVCDRIILIENGKIIEDGTHDELLSNQKAYYEMYEVQSKYYREGETYEY